MNEIKSYTFYELGTGRIVGSGYGGEFDEIPIPAGCSIYIGEAFDPKNHYFLDGQPVEYGAEEKERIKERPDSGHVWDIQTRNWVDTKTDEEKALLEKRRKHARYPTHEELCDAVFEQMSKGKMLKTEPFYSKMGDANE